MISYGVLCRKCGKHVHLAEAQLQKNQKASHGPPREVITCENCGYKAFYGIIDSHFEFVLGFVPARPHAEGHPLTREAKRRLLRGES